MSNLNRTKIRRESTSTMPSALPLGEVAFNSDTSELFVGTGTGKIKVNGKDLAEIISLLKTKAYTSEVRLTKDTIRLADLHTEVKEAMTGGSVSVVGEKAIGTENVKDNAIRNAQVHQVSLEKVSNTLVDPSLFYLWNKTSADSLIATDNSITVVKNKTGDMGAVSEVIRINKDFEKLYVTFDYMSNTGGSLWLFTETGGLSKSLHPIYASPNVFTSLSYEIPRSLLESLNVLNGFRLAWCTGADPTSFVLQNICVNTNGLSMNVVEEINKDINGNKIVSNAIESRHIKEKSIESRHLQTDLIEKNHIKDNSVTNSKITELNMEKIRNSLAFLPDFTLWGSTSEVTWNVSDGHAEYITTLKGDKGVISPVIDVSQLQYNNVYLSFVTKSNTLVDATLFDINNKYLTHLDILCDGTSDEYVEKTVRISKERLLELTGNEKFKVVIAIHQVGSFTLKRLSFNINGSSYNTLPEVIEDINYKIDSKIVSITDVKNNSKIMFTGKDIINWTSKSNATYNSNNDTITFSHTDSTGNTGFHTPSFKYTNKTHLRVKGEITTLDSGRLSLYVKGKKLADNTNVYYSISLLQKVGKFDIKVDMDKVLLNRDPIDMDSIQILISNSGVVEASAIKGYAIINDYFDFEGETLIDVLNNLRYKHIKSVDTVFADINNTSDFFKWAGGNYTHTNNQIQFSFTNESGNGGVKTKEFTSDTNFVRVTGRMSAITSHSSDGKMQVYICGKKVSTGKDTFLLVSQLTKVTDFDYVIDLNYHVVYNDLDLTKPVYVLFGSVGQVSATFENIYVYENDLSEVGIAGDNLKDTLVNIDTEIKNIKANIPNGETNNNILVSPNGNKFTLLVSDEGVLSTAPVIPNKILFIGNSLLNGHGSFGMCATNSKNDYYYHVKEYLKTFNPDVICKKIHGAVWEQAETKSVADDWVTNNINTQDSDYDMVIVQLGDNVNNDARNELFKTSCKELLQSIRRHMPRARVVWAGEWYYTTQRQNIISKACAETGSTFVDISDLKVVANQGAIGDIITRDDGTTFEVVSSGVASHPGNKGMKAIADRLIDKLF